MQEIYNRLSKIIKESSRVIVSIEGGAGAGKTTLGAELHQKFGGNLYHMDDFFLPPALRTEARRAMPGGNVHFERFYDEVIEGIISGEDFSYGVFDCTVGKIQNHVTAYKSNLHIIEGVYSAHPYFGEIYDFRIFLDIAPELQKKRIMERNPQKAKDFLKTWIPLENQYFSAFDVRGKSDIVKEIKEL